MTNHRGHKWRPLTRATKFKPPSEELIQTHMHELKQTREEVLAKMARQQRDNEVWVNDLYQVEVRRNAGMAWINIRRRDGAAILKDWRHFQQIKNEIVGPECEAVEIYPAESRLVDTSNKYHLYAFTDPTYRVPFGFAERRVMYGEEKSPGLKQRPPSMRVPVIGDPRCIGCVPAGVVPLESTP